ncbi:sensor histidine kinase [Pedobacter sp. B4-66]|uniref:sensor histidine kinase n=1 Tax=Pedobacter sp. B4-66 TaxID=2817280 RepID=UPI001BDA8EF8|nr:sensor histidine kinase [Pedobacter sp. B4-66]
MLKYQEEKRKMQAETQNSFLQAVFETQESERKRLAVDLHDSVGQVLSAIKLNLHRIDKLSGNAENASTLLASTRKLTDECIQEIRNIIHNVLPAVLIDFGLADGLKDLCNYVQQNTGIEVNYSQNLNGARFKPEIEITLYRMIQELFGNAIKHAQASVIDISLSKEAELIHVNFKDNGIGFNKESIIHGFGLKNLQSRSQLIKADIKIHSIIEKGTQTTITLNINELDN